MSLDVADSPTEFVGMVAFAFASLACWRAGSRGGSTWRALAVVHFLLVIEVFFRSRYHLHDFVDALATADGWYLQRTPVQLALIAVLVLLAGIGAVFASREHRRTGTTNVAIVATILAAMVFAIETVSLHVVDALLYAQVGPLKVIAFCWLVPASVVMLSGLRAAAE